MGYGGGEEGTYGGNGLSFTNWLCVVIFVVSLVEGKARKALKGSGVALGAS